MRITMLRVRRTAPYMALSGTYPLLLYCTAPYRTALYYAIGHSVSSTPFGRIICDLGSAPENHMYIFMQYTTSLESQLCSYYVN